MKLTATEFGLLAALTLVVIVTVGTALGPKPKHRIPVCPAGTAYVPITEMCITGAANPSRWEWR